MALTVQAFELQLLGGVGATDADVADTVLRIATHVAVRRMHSLWLSFRVCANMIIAVLLRF